MKLWFKNLDSFKKTSVLIAVVSILAFLVCVPFFFFGLKEIPLGIILGGFVCSLIFLLYEFGKQTTRMGITIAINIIKFLIIGGVIVFLAYLYYKLEIHLFNLFAVLGMYVLSTAIFAFIVIKEGKESDISSIK